MHACRSDRHHGRMQHQSVSSAMHAVVGQLVSVLHAIRLRAWFANDQLSTSHRLTDVLFDTGTQLRQQVVTQQPLYGAPACPALASQTQPCLTSMCGDCSDATNGPNHAGCLNGGKCIDGVPFDGNFTCMCASAYSGSNCQTSLCSCSQH